MAGWQDFGLAHLWVSAEPSGSGTPGNWSQMTEVLRVASLMWGMGRRPIECLSASSSWVQETRTGFRRARLCWHLGTDLFPHPFASAAHCTLLVPGLASLCGPCSSSHPEFGRQPSPGCGWREIHESKATVLSSSERISTFLLVPQFPCRGWGWFLLFPPCLHLRCNDTIHQKLWKSRGAFKAFLSLLETEAAETGSGRRLLHLIL